MRKLLPPPPKVGDTRIVRKFAWWPVVIDNTRIWLERYWLLEQLRCNIKLLHEEDPTRCVLCRWVLVREVPNPNPPRAIARKVIEPDG